MPKLIIDNIPVEVAEGVSILEAAQAVDIPIPHFCWHPSLSKAGSCRACAVKLLDGPIKGIQMSCMLPAQDGMVVSTTDPDAVAMRKSVIEWLMINHPHDCPVCDEGGECQLQDYTVAGGHGIRRFSGAKRTHVNQYLGEFIQHEMNRCIQCYRCVRFYQEYAGGTDFGVMGSAGRVYFGRFTAGPLDSPFSGNLVDICPTGVFTDRTARFRARYWDYEMASSVCQECSLGCSITPAARFRELLKVISRRNDKINSWFICDRGRFSAAANVNDPLRPRTAKVDGLTSHIDEALNALTMRIAEAVKLFGHGSIAVVGSSRLALEGAVLLPTLAAGTMAGALCYFCDEEEARQTDAMTRLLTNANSASMADVRHSDIIIVCATLSDDAPMMALAVRQAWRNGAQVYLVNQTDCEIEAEENCKTASLPGRKDSLPFEYSTVTKLDEIRLSESEKPVIICDWRSDTRMLEATLERYPLLKLAPLLKSVNSHGAAVLARDHGAISLDRALAAGGIKAVIAVEADIPAGLLNDIPFVAAIDWRATPAVAAAQIVIPTTSWAEMDGTCINNEGRALRFNRIMSPGRPVRASLESGHPSHEHRNGAPDGEAAPAWQVVARLIEQLGGERITEPLSGKWECLRTLDADLEGMVINDL